MSSQACQTQCSANFLGKRSYRGQPCWGLLAVQIACICSKAKLSAVCCCEALWIERLMVSKQGRERPQWLIHVPSRNCFCNQQTQCRENACLVVKLEMTCIILNLYEEKEKHLLIARHHAESFQTGPRPPLASNPPLCCWTCVTNPPSTLTERHHLQPLSTFFLIFFPLFFIAHVDEHMHRGGQSACMWCVWQQRAVCVWEESSSLASSGQNDNTDCVTGSSRSSPRRNRVDVVRRCACGRFPWFLSR